LPTSTPIPLPTRIPTPTVVSQPRFSPEQIHAFIERFAAQYSVDPNVLRHIAVCESGFNPDAVNGPYAGLFQFTKSTWKSNRLSLGEDTNTDLRFNAEEATQTATYLISQGKKDIWPNCYP
jgi:soluble lytic murein transglycosylase-like protein